MSVMLPSKECFGVSLRMDSPSVVVSIDIELLVVFRVIHVPQIAMCGHYLLGTPRLKIDHDPVLDDVLAYHVVIDTTGLETREMCCESIVFAREFNSPAPLAVDIEIEATAAIENTPNVRRDDKFPRERTRSCTIECMLPLTFKNRVLVAVAATASAEVECVLELAGVEKAECRCKILANAS